MNIFKSIENITHFVELNEMSFFKFAVQTYVYLVVTFQKKHKAIENWFRSISRTKTIKYSVPNFRMFIRSSIVRR